MRAKEFTRVSEASVFKTVKNQYVPGYRMSLSGSAAGQSISSLIQQQLKNFNPAEELTIADQNEQSKIVVRLPGKAEKAFKLKRKDGTVIELQGSKSSIEGGLNGIGPAVVPGQEQAQKMPNKGDTAEGLLGAAMFAKLIKREGGNIGMVTVNDLWNIFDKLQPVTDTDYLVKAKDVGGATDKIWFRLKVKGYVKNALMDPKMRAKLTSWAMSPVNYVNSKDGTEYSEQFYKNGQPDEIGIISDGLSAQTERKSDVYTLERDPQTGQTKRELLPISLKAGAEQFAQHSGSKFKAMKELFGHLGIDISGQQQEYDAMQAAGNQIEAASKIYNAAAQIINQNITNDQAEAEFVQRLNKALNFWATNDDPNVRVVSFGTKGKYEVLRFDNLLPLMKNLKFNAEFVPGENPKLYVKDQEQGILFQIRTYLQTKEGGKYQRNVIEKGPLLSKIANAIS